MEIWSLQGHPHPVTDLKETVQNSVLSEASKGKMGLDCLKKDTTNHPKTPKVISSMLRATSSTLNILKRLSNPNCTKEFLPMGQHPIYHEPGLIMKDF